MLRPEANGHTTNLHSSFSHPELIIFLFFFLFPGTPAVIKIREFERFAFFSHQLSEEEEEAPFSISALMTAAIFFSFLGGKGT